MGSEMCIRDRVKYVGPCSVSSGINGHTASTLTYEYDAEGRVTALVTDVMNHDGVKQRTERSYDSEGRLVEEFSLSESGERAYTKTLAYDARGNLVKEHIESRKATTTRTLRYDDQGRVSGESTNSGEVRHTYDDQGRLTSKKHLDTKGAAQGTTALTYDAAGNVLSEVRTNAEGTVIRAMEYLYDDGGRRTSETMKRGDRVVVVTLTHYEGDNPVRVETDHRGDGHIDATKVLRYDTAGNLLSEELDVTGDGRTLETTTYGYGCWGSSAAAH